MKREELIQELWRISASSTPPIEHIYAPPWAERILADFDAQRAEIDRLNRDALNSLDALDAENINLRRKVKDLERQMMTAAKNYAKKKGSNV